MSTIWPWRQIGFISVVSAMLWWPHAVAAETVAVPMQGVAALTEPDPRTAALDRAFAAAVEQVAMSMVPAQAQDRWQAVVRSEVVARPRLYVASFRVDAERDDAGQKRIAATVQVDVDKLAAKLSELGVPRASRLASVPVHVTVEPTLATAAVQNVLAAAAHRIGKSIHYVSGIDPGIEGVAIDGTVACSAGTARGVVDAAAYCVAKIRWPGRNEAAGQHAGGAIAMSADAAVTAAATHATRFALEDVGTSGAPAQATSRSGVRVRIVGGGWRGVTLVRTALERGKFAPIVAWLGGDGVELAVAGTSGAAEALLRAVPEADVARERELIVVHIRAPSL